MNDSTTTVPFVATRLTLVGHVQGIGMRPSIVRFAESLDLVGYVSNTNAGLQIHVEGPVNAVEQFVAGLPDRVPTIARIVSSCSNETSPQGFETFFVKQETNLASNAKMSVHIPLDLVPCESCRGEVVDTNDRRHVYPFTSCTDCGPRYSMIERMPYERDQTSMARFPLCDHCRHEYDSPFDRRFQSQANACPTCGPKLWVCDAHSRVIAGGNDALRCAAAELKNGRIVAMRGLGGYQLLVDATSQEAVQRLRQRKGREFKPFAVMVSCLEDALQLAVLDDAERCVLAGPAGPIVITESRSGTALAQSVTLGVGTVGLLLPTTPLHGLLLNEVCRPLVCTSGNVEGEPIVYVQRSALESLSGIADIWLEHDREILRPIDDSVVRIIANRVVSFRLARGLAPMVLNCPSDEPIIAVGGQQKVSLALSNGSQAVLGPHIGDMNTIAARERFVDQVEELENLYGIRDSSFVGDSHPDYFTTSWLERQSRRFVQVQHHHAHIVGGMLEHGWLDRQVLGVAFDGAGYGTDGKSWGGEFLLCTATNFHRIGHLRPFSLPGGDHAAREPWRIATTLVRDSLGDAQAAELTFRTGNVASLIHVLQRPKLSPTTTSVGRLFDGVAALTLGIERCEYEGQAAILMESACDESTEGAYKLSIKSGGLFTLDWRSMIRQIMRDRANGETPGAMAMRFHRGLADAISRVCRDFASIPIVLWGGVFQNRVLIELLARRVPKHLLGLPGKIPPGDGGLAAGQLAIATATACQRRSHSCA
jgi:hydrogenase maturation protein HypF